MAPKRLIDRAGIILMLCVLKACLAEDPSSFRSVDTLLSGLWVQDAPPPAPPTIDFRPDRSFEAFSSAIPGVLVADYTGNFWQASGVLAFRGTSSASGVRVQFVTFEIVESPSLSLRMTQILDPFIIETVGVAAVSDMSAAEVQSALRRLDGLPIPENALGDSWTYSK